MTDRGGRVTQIFANVAHTFSHLAILIYATVVLALEVAMDMPFADLAWLALPGFVLFGVAALPAGWLGDRWSAAGMIAVFFFGVGGSLVLTGLADGPLGLLIGLTAIGAFAAIYHPVGVPWLIKNAPRKGRALGINGVFGNIGTAGAALLAGALADLAGWRAAFIVPGVVCVAVGVAFLVALRRGVIVERAEDRSPPPPAAAGDRRRTFGVLAVTVLCTGLTYQATTVGLPKLFSERLPDLAGQGTLGVGLMVTLVYTVAALAQVLGGHLADRWPPRQVYLLSLALQIPVLALAFTVYNPALVALVAVMASLNVGGQPAENVMLANYTPMHWRGRVFGAKFVLTLGVSAFGVALVPFIHATTGSLDALFLALIVFAGVATTAAWFLPKGTAPAPLAQPAE